MIAALLLDDDGSALARVRPILEPVAFFREANRWCYEAAVEVADRGEPITVVTLAHELQRADRLDDAGGEAYLVELGSKYFTAVGVEAHARIVAQSWLLRRAINMAGDVARVAYGGQNLDDVLGRVDELFGELRAEANRTRSRATAAEGSNGHVDWSSFWSRDHREEDFAIAPLFPRNRAIAMYSPAKVGKSLLLLDLLARAATGRPVLDQPAGKPLNVVYLDLEMTEGDLFERLSDLGYGPESDLSRLHYYLLPSLPPLDTAAGGQALRAICTEHDADIVAIDTTSRVLSGAENEADTLRAFYAHTGLPLKTDGRTVVRLDHSGKDLERGQRGSSAKNDDVDLVWQLSKRESGAVLLKATHRRQSWVPETVELVQLSDPLRHELALEASYPEGTEAVARQLDALDTPTDLGRDKVRAILREQGIRARNDVIGGAIRYRKARGQVTGTGDMRGPGTGDGDRSGNRFGDRSRDRSGQGSGAYGDRPPSLEGDRSPLWADSSPGDNRCVDCATPCGSAVRCPRCASARVSRGGVR